jgi:hypothetical protein
MRSQLDGAILEEMLNHPILASNGNRGGVWLPLTSTSARMRFAEIMQLMDARYADLGRGLDSWLEGLIDSGQHAELFGWCADDTQPENAIQVMALTSRLNAIGKRENARVRMLGVAADRIPPSQWREDDIQVWFARFLGLVHELLGGECEFSAMRPKSMTWKPMERLHDLVQQGARFEVIEDGKRTTYAADVTDSRDRGETLYWRIRLAPIAG